MEPNNRPGHNANNNLRANGPTATNSGVQMSTLVWRLVTQIVQMVFRMYLTVLVVVYQWGAQTLSRVLAPLQPALDQARKVPKQDVSVQGIVYQYLRLIFLLLLYFSPWAVRAAAYLLDPLRRLRDWAVAYVESPIGGAPGKESQSE